MLLSTEIASLAKKVGEREAIKIIKEAGFDAFDMSLFELNRDENYYLN